VGGEIGPNFYPYISTLLLDRVSQKLQTKTMKTEEDNQKILRPSFFMDHSSLTLSDNDS
jgi:hypothetical protein